MTSFRECRFGYAALGISAAEIIAVCVGVAIIQAAGLWGRAPIWVRHVYERASLAVPVALTLAIVGLFKDSQKICAVAGLLLALVAAAVYGVLLAV